MAFASSFARENRFETITSGMVSNAFGIVPRWRSSGRVRRAVRLGAPMAALMFGIR
jgi:hypothetical protein